METPRPVIDRTDIIVAATIEGSDLRLHSTRAAVHSRSKFGDGENYMGFVNLAVYFVQVIGIEEEERRESQKDGHNTRITLTGMQPNSPQRKPSKKRVISRQNSAHF